LKSPFHNAVDIFNLSKMNQRTLPIPSNLAFHDLTPNKSAPLEAKALLGLGGKFISTPSYTTGDITASVRRFHRDICIKVIFGGQK
jgi:hypothetical protein